ncbi:MAG: LLM class F420-dependent oxidoreductase [Alphaproteobacteria bacterium]|jgi:F420-dependent oxidoreductase-like protein
MKLGLLLGYSGSDMNVGMDRVLEAENLGYDSVWTSEAWGSDAITPAAWVLAQTSKIKVGTAICQMQSRTPALAAMTTMTLNAMSGGRFILGVGPSGPQVIEGWHGVPYGKPLMRTREYIEIIRKAIKREGPLVHDGEHYQIPYTGAGSTGLGKPLKSILHADPNIKIYSASFSPKGVENAAKCADGIFPIFMAPEKFDLFGAPLEKGFAKTEGKSLANFDILPFVECEMGSDLDACRRPIKEHMALYIGGMGARDKNFYNDYCKMLGYEDAAVEIQDKFLGRDRAGAADAVPDSLVDEVALVGPRERIRERLVDWKSAAKDRKIDTMLLRGTTSVEAIRMMAEEVL